MSMNIYAKCGDTVLVTKETAHNGYDSDKEKVEQYLQIGKLYTISETDVHSSSTTVYLKEFPDLSWNSVNFIDYVPKPNDNDFEEIINLGGIDNSEPIINMEAYGFAFRKWLRENKDQIEARKMYKEGVTKLSDSEMIVSSIKAFDKDVNGCLRHKKDVMISYTKEGSETIYDLFLDKNQAQSLLGELTKSLDNE